MLLRRFTFCCQRIILQTFGKNKLQKAFISNDVHYNKSNVSSINKTAFLSSLLHHNKTAMNISIPSLQTITPFSLPNLTGKIEYKLPTLTSKQIIVHQDLPKLIDKIDPLMIKWDIRVPNDVPIIKKEAIRMIRIRRLKMNRHKLKKLRKRMRFVWARLRQKREMKKEKAFHAELRAMIKEAEDFDAEQYVANILHVISDRPHVETQEERIRRIRELIRQNRSNVRFLTPEYDHIK